MHLPDHVAYAMNSAPKVRRRFPSCSLKPLPTHPRLRPDSHADELEKADRSQRSAFIFWVPLLGATALGRGRRELRNHESDLPDAQLWVRGLHDAREGSWASDYLGLISLCVWETASLVKTRQGASRQEREFSLLSAGFEVWDLIDASNGVIRIYGCTY
jgi:hypothetical protein